MQPAPDTGRRLALLVATSVYSDPDLRQLRARGGDAAELSEVLRDPRIGGFEVQMLVNAPSGEVQEGIEDFCADRHPDDQLLIYLSCHGVLDSNGRLYYAAINTRRQRLAATAIAAAWLNERLEDARARRQILVLDCGYSGAFARGAKGDQELASQQRFEPHGRGRVVLTASRSIEYSFEGGPASGEGVPSVFTPAIVNGLRTGDADRDKDGLITVTDLYQYVYDTVRAAEPRQTPELWTYGAEGNLLVAHSIRGAVIEPEPLPEDLRITLESPRRRVRETGVAELAELLDTARPSLALAARRALERIAEEDHPQVAELARTAVGAAAGAAADQVRRELTERAHREEQARQQAARRQAEEKVQREAEEKARREAQEAARRHARSAEPSSPSPGSVVDDDVRFTVYRPEVLYPEQWAQMLVFAHKTDPVVEPGRGLVDPTDLVEERARTHFGGTPPRPAAADARQELARGAQLRIIPDLPDLRCNPAYAEVEWWEPVHEVVFRLLAPRKFAGIPVRGAVRIWCGPLILGEVTITIRVAAAGPATEPQLVPEPVQRHHKIFPSYSHKDSAIVARVAEAADALGHQFLQDVLTLRAGERWNKRLQELIKDADAFQLFWSSHSMHSPHCQHEWEYALRLQRPSFIKPVYWEDPLPEDPGHELPPAELRELHFKKLEHLAPDPAGEILAQAVTAGRPPTQPEAYTPDRGTPVGRTHQGPARRGRRKGWRRASAAAAFAFTVAAGLIEGGCVGGSVPTPAPTASASPAPSATASPRGPGWLPTGRLRPGYCLAGQNLPLNTTHPWPRTVHVVPCGQQHAAVVYYSSNYWPADLAYPGERVKLRLATRKCNQAFRSYFGIPYSPSTFAVRSISPGRAEWVSGDRQLICVASKRSKK